MSVVDTGHSEGAVRVEPIDPLFVTQGARYYGDTAVMAEALPEKNLHREGHTCSTSRPCPARRSTECCRSGASADCSSTRTTASSWMSTRELARTSGCATRSNSHRPRRVRARLQRGSPPLLRGGARRVVATLADGARPSRRARPPRGRRVGDRRRRGGCTVAQDRFEGAAPGLRSRAAPEFVHCLGEGEVYGVRMPAATHAAPANPHPADETSIVALERFIHATRDSGYRGTASAVAELLDNSLQAGATRIHVAIASASTDDSLTLAVLDNGCGIDAATLGQALRFGGSTRFNDRRGLGAYGMGLPNSWLSQRGAWTSSRGKRRQGINTYLGRRPRSPRGRWGASPSRGAHLPPTCPEPPARRGTLVVWSRW